jgi:beta-glucanase (GH16 family)
MTRTSARPLVLVVAATLLSVLTASLGAESAAAAPHRAPSVAVRLTGADTVAVSGRTASASARVRIDRRVGSRWVAVKSTRAHHHRYRMSLAVRAGTSATFRATADLRSRRFVVRMPAPVPPTTSPSPAPPPVDPPPATPPPTQYDACGAQPLKADGTPWQCTFHDDFEGTELDHSKWVAQTAFLTGDPKGVFACYVDSPNNISVADGSLRLTVRKEAAPQPCGTPDSTVTSSYTSGSVSTYQLFSQEYGRYEARIRNTATSESGLQETFWLWPDDRDGPIDPQQTGDTGEIDVSETYSNYSSLTVPRLHYAADPKPDPGVNTAYCSAERGVWNTYTLEWTPTTITVFVNGHLCLTNTSADPVFHRRHIVLLTQALGDANNPATDATPIPATMDVDYVHVWQ